MSTPQEPGNQPPQQPEGGSDETIVNGDPAVDSDATVVGGPPLPPVPSESLPGWGAPPPPPAPEPFVPGAMDDDATTVGIHEPYGPWLTAADRAGADQPAATGGPNVPSAPGVGSAAAPPPPPPAAQASAIGPMAGAPMATGPAQAGPPPSGSGNDPEAERKRRKRRRRIIVWIVVVLVVAALVAAGFVTRSILAKGKYGPQHQVEDYLQAVVDGDAKTAVKLLDPNVTNDKRVLLTDEVYKKTEGRPTEFSIDSTEFNGDHATVTASVVQDGKSEKQDFFLTKDGKTDVVFDEWKIDSGPQQDVGIGSVPKKLKVNGVLVDFGAVASSDEDQKTNKLPVLPGRYAFAAPKGSKYVSYGKDIELTRRFGPEPDGGKAPEPVSFSTSYTPEVYKDVESQLDEAIASCTKDKDMFVEGCLAASWENTDHDATNDITREWADGKPGVLITSEENDEVADSPQVVTKLHGDLEAVLDGGEIHVTGKVRDKDSESSRWNGPYDDYLDPFRTGSDYMVFPISIDGDTLKVKGLKQLNAYDPANINPGNQKKFSMYPAIGD